MNPSELLLLAKGLEKVLVEVELEQVVLDGDVDPPADFAAELDLADVERSERLLGADGGRRDDRQHCHGRDCQRPARDSRFSEHRFGLLSRKIWSAAIHRRFRPGLARDLPSAERLEPRLEYDHAILPNRRRKAAMNRRTPKTPPCPDHPIMPQWMGGKQAREQTPMSRRFSRDVGDVRQPVPGQGLHDRDRLSRVHVGLSRRPASPTSAR